MSKKFSLDMLTEGIRQRHLGSQNRQLVEKWARTGLLRGMKDVHRENMARLLENQASQVLKEQSSVGVGTSTLASSGDLRGFTNIAFPIVRRVFGGLIANELVSIQPMSLPSGLIFYLDYTRGDYSGKADSDAADLFGTKSSIYNQPAGSGVRSGSLATGGQYDLAGVGFSRVYETKTGVTVLASGSFRGQTAFNALANQAGGGQLVATGSDAKLLQFDPQITRLIEDNDGGPGAGSGNGVFQAVVLSMDGTNYAQFDTSMVKSLGIGSGSLGVGKGTNGYKVVGSDVQPGNVYNVMRLNQVGTWNGTNFTADPFVKPGDANAAILTIVSGAIDSTTTTANVTFPIKSTLNTGDGDTLAIPAFESDFGATPDPVIPEIDIKVESIPVVAETRKLRARWSPELAQDLNAYHSLDAEVELTQILSEQIALEIDREILNDLLTEAGAANYYWSRAPGKFVNKETGTEVLANDSLAPGPSFRGTVREWYETLVETIIDVANQVHRKTLRGSANFIVVGPDVATILEASVYYKPNFSLDGDGQVSQPMTLGADLAGTLSNRFTVYKDPYFPRNKVLVGYKGGSYLETGYVYAPYVPLIVTPTIFQPDDFTPRKGVMTRYGKKMVRSDFYGTVTCLDMNVI